MKKEYHFAE